LRPGVPLTIVTKVHPGDFTKKHFESRFAATVKVHHQMSLLSLDRCDYLKAAGG
jgi:hypothetical protein